MERIVTYAIAIGMVSALVWIALIAIIQLARRFADLTLPEWPSLLGRTAAMAVVMAGLMFVPFGFIVGAAIAGILVQKWFDADFTGAAIVVLLTLLAVRLVEFAVMGMMFPHGK